MIIKENQGNKVKFSELKYGDVFRYSGGYFIKTPTIHIENGVLNAVFLDDGHNCTFMISDLVEQVDAVLNVK